MKKILFNNISDVFNGSIALIGVCLIVITLFQVTDKSAIYLVDECLSLTIALLLTCVFFSYLSMKWPKREWLNKYADRAFALAVTSILLSFLVLLYEFYFHA